MATWKAIGTHHAELVLLDFTAKVVGSPGVDGGLWYLDCESLDIEVELGSVAEFTVEDAAREAQPILISRILDMVHHIRKLTDPAVVVEDDDG